MTKLENAKEHVVQRLAVRIRNADPEDFYEMICEVEDRGVFSVLRDEKEHLADCLTCEMCRHVYGDCEDEDEELIESMGYENYEEQEICRKRFLDFYKE